jgi:Zn-dependent peptidase ImmA (M78 family)
MNIRVNGKTLESLRKRYKASFEGASHITGYDAEKIKQWEAEGVELSISEAKKLAKAYHSHWSIFLLESKVKPIEEPINNRAGYSDSSPFSTETLYAYEEARRLINVSIEIDGQTVSKEIKEFATQGKHVSATQRAKQVRQILDITSQDILHIKGAPDEVYKFWKTQVSSLGIYISEQKMPEEETKAFLLRDGNRAIIVINKNDRYPFSKVFSLLHELGHIIKGEPSAACKISEQARRVSSEESWCNSFASEMVALDSDVMQDPLVDTVRSSDDPSAIIRRLATKYRTSFTVMLFKLKRHDKVTERQCGDILAFFEKNILSKFKPRKDPEKEIKLGKQFYISRDVSKASFALSKEVVERQLHGSISYSEAAMLLGTKAGYLEDIKNVVGYGS